MSLGRIVSGSPNVLVGCEKAARKSDLMDHGGLITTGCPTVVINGSALLAARVGDKLACPSFDGKQHKGGIIVLPGCTSVVVGGMPAARVGDYTLCLGPGADDGGGAGGGGGASEREADAECVDLWDKYQEEAENLIRKPIDDDHRERNKVISAAYADLCLQNPEFQWAGLAAYASKQVGCAMDHATKVRNVALGAGALGAPAVVPIVGGAGSAAIGQYTYDMLGVGNRNLFVDIYPMHRFYQDHGFAKMAKCAGERKPPIPAQALDGFRALERYKQTGDKTFLEQSVKSLAFHEQVNILQRDIYNDAAFQKILRVNETKMLQPATLPADVVLGSGCDDPTGGKQTHTFGEKGRTKLYDVSERMEWIVKDIATDYATFAGSKRHTDDLEEIRRQGAMAGWKAP
jgi:uncharacterized Zn-binding protein involved in type VI secretion